MHCSPSDTTTLFVIVCHDVKAVTNILVELVKNACAFNNTVVGQ
jgi:hypothetical protein